LGKCWLHLGVLAALAAAIALPATPASAATPAWAIDTLAQSHAAEGESFVFQGQVTNVGDVPLDGSAGPIVVSGELPTGLVLEEVSAKIVGSPIPCAGVAGTFTCTDSSHSVPVTELVLFRVRASVQPGATGVLTASFRVEGGDPTNPAADTVDPTTIAAEPPGFGIDAFDGRFSADSSGTPLAQAGAHPYDSTNSLDFNTVTHPDPLKGVGWPVEPFKDVYIDLPPGLVADTTPFAQCSLSELAEGDGVDAVPLCAPGSQMGVAKFRLNVINTGTVIGPLPIYNMSPPGHAPARLGFNVLGSVIVLDAAVRGGGEGLSIVMQDVSEGLAIAGTTLVLWGAPASPDHTAERACPGAPSPARNGPTCASEAEEVAFLRAPTSCGEALVTTVRADSWRHPGDFEQAGFANHLPRFYPYPREGWGPAQALSGCESVPFDPSISIRPSVGRAASPTGLTVDLELPQSDDPASTTTSDLRSAAVRLAGGLTVNAAAGDGLAACARAQIGLTSATGSAPVRFDESPGRCPDAAKIGSAEVETPLIGHVLRGGVYLATPRHNPFGSLLAVYVAIDDRESGVVIKLAGQLSTAPDRQLRVRFDENPQLPFERLRLELFGGPRAVLRTPGSCGLHSSRADLGPWSGNPMAELASGFQLSAGPEGRACPSGALEPAFAAGTVNPVAAAASPFVLRLARADGTQELGSVEAALAAGLSARLKRVRHCPDAALAAAAGRPGSAELAGPSCPAASRLGTATVAAGAGPTPYRSPGTVYLAGPYRNAPFSVAVVVPAAVGPFDLGTEVVRIGIQVDPRSARLTVAADPLPTSLEGIPIDLRSIQLLLDRPNFVRNPSSCDADSIEATVGGAGGGSVRRTERFQVTGCQRLGFRPRLSLALSGPSHRGAHPKLRIALIGRRGDANVSQATILLPPTESFDSRHIRQICSASRYAEDTCPRNSAIGHGKVWTPLLDEPLRGPVYLRSSGAKRVFPDLVADLSGAVDIDLVGQVDSVAGRLRVRFRSLPDIPIGRFVLAMDGGARGLLVNNTDVCRGRPRATALLDAHNGKLHDARPRLKARCGSGRT
jgi:hypothetical protein